MRYIEIVAKAIVLLVLLLLFDLFFVILDNFIVGDFEMFSIRSWVNYDLIRMRNLHRIIAIVVFSCSVSLLWEYLIRSTLKHKYWVGILVLCLLTVITVGFYHFIEKVCFLVERSTTEFHYEEAFGSIFNMRVIIGLYIGLIFLIGIFTTCSGAYIRNRMHGSILIKIFSHYTIYVVFLSNVLPIMLYMAGIGWMRMLKIPVISIALFASGLPIVIYILRRVNVYRKVKKYYDDYAKSTASDSLEIRVSEDNDEPSTLYKFFWKDQSLIKKLEEQQIYIVTDEICARETEVGISLDLYAYLLLYSEKRRSRLIANKLSRKSVFHIAGCGDKDDLEYLNEYDDAFTLDANLPNNLSKYVKLIDFRRKQVKLLSEIRIDDIRQKNCIANQIIAFRDYLYDEYELFNVFDYCIKWLEIINYFYTLIMISHKNVKVSSINLNKMDFGRWIYIRNKYFKDETLYKEISDEAYEDISLFTVFNRIWYTIKEQKEYQFKGTKSIGELLSAAKELRNCTRGHGVFTFEISPELNLNILTLLVGFINFMIDNHWLDDDFINLEKNRWVIRYEGRPYFLYSHDPNSNEYHFDSFQAGNSLPVPDNSMEGSV